MITSTNLNKLLGVNTNSITSMTEFLNSDLLATICTFFVAYSLFFCFGVIVQFFIQKYYYKHQHSFGVVVWVNFIEIKSYDKIWWGVFYYFNTYQYFLPFSYYTALAFFLLGQTSLFVLAVNLLRLNDLFKAGSWSLIFNEWRKFSKTLIFFRNYYHKRPNTHLEHLVWETPVLGGILFYQAFATVLFPPFSFLIRLSLCWGVVNGFSLTLLLFYVLFFVPLLSLCLLASNQWVQNHLKKMYHPKVLKLVGFNHFW